MDKRIQIDFNIAIGESILILYSLFLSKPFCNKPYFKSFHFAINSILFLIDPHASDEFYPFGWFYKILNLTKVHELHLKHHSVLPKFCIFILDCLIVITRIDILFIWDLVKRLSQEHVSIRLWYNPPTMMRYFLWLCINYNMLYRF